MVFTTTALASSTHHKGRSVEKRVSWLQERVSHHRFVCRHGGGKNKAFSCKALRWSKRELAEAKIEKLRHDTVQQLNRGFANSVHVFGRRSPMEGTGKELEAAGWRYHVSPFFIAGIAGTESSLGLAACSNNRYNSFGLSSCGSGWSVPSFGSWKEVYNFMGQFLSSKWPNARAPWDYGGYAACSACWGSHTASLMQKLFGVGPSTVYGVV